MSSLPNSSHCQNLLQLFNNYQGIQQKIQQGVDSFHSTGDEETLKEVKDLLQPFKQAQEDLINASQETVEIHTSNKVEKVNVMDYLVIKRLIRMLSDEDKKSLEIAGLVGLLNKGMIKLDEEG